MANAAFGGVPRVNLMPQSEIDRRERRVLLRRWLIGLIGVLVVTTLVGISAFSVNLLAAKRLLDENDRTNRLLVELASLSEVSEKITQQRELTDYREAAMRADLEWSPLLSSLVGVLPAGVHITSFDGAPGVGPYADDPASAPGVTLSLAFESPEPIDIVTVVRAVRSIPTVFTVEGTELTRNGPVLEDPNGSDPEGQSITYAYLLTVTSTEAVYSGRFLPDDDTAETAAETEED